MNQIFLKNLLRSLNRFSYLLFLLLFINCIDKKNQVRIFNPLPLSTGQFVEYVKDSIPYDSFHVRFLLLDLKSDGFSLETDYITSQETLKIKTFHNIKDNYLIDTFKVQYNSETPLKFVNPGGNFIFDSPISNIMIWINHVDSTNWRSFNLNNDNYIVFPVKVNNDSIYYCSEIPIFNSLRIKLDDYRLTVSGYGNKGASSLFTTEKEILITNENIPKKLRENLNVDKR